MNQKINLYYNFIWTGFLIETFEFIPVLFKTAKFSNSILSALHAKQNFVFVSDCMSLFLISNQKKKKQDVTVCN